MVELKLSICYMYSVLRTNYRESIICDNLSLKLVTSVSIYFMTQMHAIVYDMYTPQLVN
jgi:hypothetical protein